MAGELAILETSFRSMATIMLVNMVGSMLVFYPYSTGGLLTRPFLQQLAKLFNHVLLPAMVVTGLGSKFSLDLIAEAWILVVVSAIHIAIGFLSANVTARFVKPSPSLRRPFVASSSVHNALVLPLILFTTLADQSPVNEDEDALERGSTFIFIYTMCYTVIIWGVFPTYLRAAPAHQEARQPLEQATAAAQPVTTAAGAHPVVDEEAQQQQQKQATGGEWGGGKDLVNALTHPGMVGTFIGTFIGCIKPLQKALFDDGVGVLNPIGKAISMIGEPGLGIMVLVLSGSLGHGLRDAITVGCLIERSQSVSEKKKKSRSPREKQLGEEEDCIDVEEQKDEKGGEKGENEDWKRVGGGGTEESSPTSLSAVSEVRTITPSTGRRDRGKEGGILSLSGGTTDGGKVVDSGANLRHDDKGNEEDYQGKLTLYQLLVFAVGRTIITPLLLLGVNIVLKEVWLKDQDDPLLLLIVFLEPITPSPTSIITLLQSMGRYRATESLAQGYLIQYIISVISMTAFTGLALHFSYE